MKLWEKGFNTQACVEQFTVDRDRELDRRLAPFDVLGSLAHARMLAHIGIFSPLESEQVQGVLKNIYQDIQEGRFKIEENVEDVHSQIEIQLIRTLGETGKKIHTGRSRNDQILVDIRLFVRHELIQQVGQVQELFAQLIHLSETYQSVPLPGYTHFQIAMPSSFGLWFAAYAESLLDDLLSLQAAYRIINKNPLGSAAGYGSSFPLNRQMTTDLLGFDALNYNVIYAQMGRGKTEKQVAQALAALAATLGKLAMDICLYMSQNFDFIMFPREFTTGSSIMPHKKNPDVFEIIRGKCNQLQSVPLEIQLITGNLPSGYHRDMQMLKAPLWNAFEDMAACLKMMTGVLPHIIVRKDILAEPKYRYLHSVEAVHQRVGQGVPFRDAYQQVAQAIERGDFTAPPPIQHTHEGSSGNLCNEQIAAALEALIAQFRFDRVEKALADLLAAH